MLKGCQLCVDCQNLKEQFAKR
ncbi:MAG: hypothetical protein M3Z47_06150 [Gilliamella apis]|nr:hypothetical protein [Gilliamella apis]